MSDLTHPEAHGFVYDASLPLQRRVERMAEFYAEGLSHSGSRPYRHGGECLCVRGELAVFLAHAGCDL